MLRQPALLKAGDTIAIISTARKINEAELAGALTTFQSWGLKVVLGESIGKENHQFAGSDEERAADLQQFLDSSKVSAIVCARGGYGTVRIMKHLHFSGFLANPKWLVGYSDVTVLHAHINCYLGIQSLHATMPINFDKNTPEALLSLRNNLMEPNYSIAFDHSELNREGECEAPIIGGNLSILYSILGTSSGFNPDNRILFIEDLDEYLYHVDRMMMALKRAGKLQHLKGLIVGALSDMNDNTIPFGKTAKEIVLEHVEEYDYPVCFDFPAGHITNNKCLPFGREANLKIGKTCSLQFK